MSTAKAVCPSAKAVVQTYPVGWANFFIHQFGVLASRVLLVPLLLDAPTAQTAIRQVSTGKPPLFAASATSITLWNGPGKVRSHWVDLRAAAWAVLPFAAPVDE